MENKKYKFTGKEKVVFGVTLKQIVCVTAFASISVGDVGGWIEKENNLDQYGDAWVYGNARVFGNARVYGNAEVFGNSKSTKLVKTINSGIYHVTITDNNIAIGCQNHTYSQWKRLSKNKAVDMLGERDAGLWFKYKDFILTLSEE